MSQDPGDENDATTAENVGVRADGRCRNCVWWVKDGGAEAWGSCGRMVASSLVDTPGHIHTVGIFGCNLWERIK